MTVTEDDSARRMEVALSGGWAIVMSEVLGERWWGGLSLAQAGDGGAGEGVGASGAAEAEGLPIGAGIETREAEAVSEVIGTPAGDEAGSGAEGRGAFTLAEGLMAAGVGLMVLTLMMNIRKRRRRAAEGLSPREEMESDRRNQAVRDDMSKVMVEVEELARRFGAQLDAKSIELERLLDEADATIAELKRLGGGEAGDEDEGVVRVVSVSAARKGEGNVEGGREGRTGGERESAAAADPLTARVYAMADGGRSAVEIAQGLNEDVGKVELILALRRA